MTNALGVGYQPSFMQRPGRPRPGHNNGETLRPCPGSCYAWKMRALNVLFRHACSRHSVLSLAPS